MLIVSSQLKGAGGPPRSPRQHNFFEGAQVASPRGLAGRRRSGRRQLSVLAFKEGEPEPDKQQTPRSAGAGDGSDAMAAAAGPCAPVTFKACRHVAFGQVLKVVGGLPQLGDWDCEKAPAMAWTEGDQRLLTADLPAGRHEFKVVVAHAAAGCYDWESGPNRVVQVPVPEAAARRGFTVVCEWGHTASSLETLPEEELGLDEALSSNESDEPSLRPEDLRAEPYSANGDEGEAPVSVVGTMAKEGGPSKPSQVSKGGKAPGAPAAAAASQGTHARPAASAATNAPAAPPEAGGAAGKKISKVHPAVRSVRKAGAAKGGGAGPGVRPASPSTTSEGSGSKGRGGSAPDTGGSSGSAGGAHAAVKMEAGDYPSQTPMGEGADAAVGGEPAGGLKPSTEAAVKREMQQAAGRAAATQERPAQPGLLSRFLQALSWSKKEDESKDIEDDDDYGEGPGSGSGGASSSGTGAAGGAARTPQQGQEGQGPQGGAAAMTTVEPSQGLLLAATAAGLLALPVVAWSEWVLKSTGCGLPPGPSGLLGAAEGVSYLVVGSIALWSLTRKVTTGSGLPAGPGGALGAVERASWLAVAAGGVVLALQLQTYGYIPSALPDSNCFGAEVPEARSAGSAAASRFSGQAGAAPELLSPFSTAGAASSSQAAPHGGFGGGVLRLPAGGPTLPQGNLLFSAAEGVLSQSVGIMEAAETAAAAFAAAAAGQPPPEAVAAAVQHLQMRAQQAQQLAAGIVTRAAGSDVWHMQQQAQAAAAAPAPQQQQQQQQQQAPPQLEPLSFQPPRHKVRAALKSSWAALQQNEKLKAMMEPIPLPAVARQAAAAAGSALDAVEYAEERIELVGQEVSLEERRVLAFGRRTWGNTVSSAQRGGEQLRGAASTAGARLTASLPPQMQRWVAAAPSAPPPPQQQQQQKQQLKPKAPVQTSASTVPRSPRTVAAAQQASSAAPQAGKAAPPKSAGTAISADMFASVVADLKEGYAGLWRSAREFEPRQAAQVMEERIRAGKQQAAAAKSKAANGTPAAASKAPAAAGASKTAAAVPKAPASAAVPGSKIATPAAKVSAATAAPVIKAAAPAAKTPAAATAPASTSRAAPAQVKQAA